MSSINLNESPIISERMPVTTLNPRLLEEKRLLDFTFIMREAAKMQSAGEKLASLGIGIPIEVEPPETVPSILANRLISVKRLNVYSDFIGETELRKEFVKQLSQKSGRTDLNLDQFLVTAGAQAAMMSTLMAVIEPGQRDGILLPTPFYLCYEGQIVSAGGIPITVNMNRSTSINGNWALREMDIEHSLIQAQKEGINVKAIILNDPHNPTGHVHTKKEISGIARLALRHGLIILADYTYDEFVFADNHHINLAGLKELDDRLVVINSVSKAFGMTGWRIASAWTGNTDLLRAMATAHNFLTVTAATPSQIAATLALQNGDGEYCVSNIQKLLASRQALLDGLSQVPHLLTPVGQPEGAYYLLAKTHPSLGNNGLEAALTILKTTGVITAPGTSFGFPEGIRLSFGGPPALITKAFDRLKEKYNSM